MRVRFGQIFVGAAFGALVTVLAYEQVPPAAPSAPDGDGTQEPSNLSEPVRAASQASTLAPARPVPAEIERLRAENQLLRGQLATFGANEVDWPDHPAFAPDEVQSLVADVFPDVPAAYDCEEFPCIATLRLSGGTTRAALDDQARDVWMRLDRTVKTRLPPDIVAQWYTYTGLDPEGRPVILTTFYPEDVATQLDSRVETRLERLRDEASEGHGP